MFEFHQGAHRFADRNELPARFQNPAHLAQHPQNIHRSIQRIRTNDKIKMVCRERQLAEIRRLACDLAGVRLKQFENFRCFRLQQSGGDVRGENLHDGRQLGKFRAEPAGTGADLQDPAANIQAAFFGEEGNEFRIILANGAQPFRLASRAAGGMRLFRLLDQGGGQIDPVFDVSGFGGTQQAGKLESLCSGRNGNQVRDSRNCHSGGSIEDSGVVNIEAKPNFLAGLQF